MRPTPPDNTVTVGNNQGNPQSPASTAIDVLHNGRQKETCWRKIVNWFDHKSKWLEDMRGMLSVVSTMITTITFQSSINPPGGVFQAGYESFYNCTRDHSACAGAGAAVLSILYPESYDIFQLYNTICFVSSISVTFLLLSGLPLNHRFPMLILSLGMSATLTFLALTYRSSLQLLCPSNDYSEGRSYKKPASGSISIWLGLVGILTLLFTIRFLVWLVKKCIKAFKHRKGTVPTSKGSRGRFQVSQSLSDFQNRHG